MLCCAVRMCRELLDEKSGKEREDGEDGTLCSSIRQSRAAAMEAVEKGNRC